MVWATQFVGGAGPQWAGRYTLASCTVLVALGVAALQRASRGLRLGLIGLTALVTVTGVLWLSERSNEVDRTFDVLVERSEDVVVVQNGFFIREGGAAYSERRWLTAVSDVDLSFAVEVIERSGLDTFVVLAESPSAPDRLAGARLVETNVLTIFGDPQYLHSYTL
jgi:hypothetical protein